MVGNSLRWPVVLVFALLVGAALVGCSGESDSTPTATTTPEATATSAVTATAVPVQPVASLALPEGCRLFDGGRWDPSPPQVGQPVEVELSVFFCARPVLEAVRRLIVDWHPEGLDAPVVTSEFVRTSNPNRWSATIRLPEPGIWTTAPGLGAVPLLETYAMEDGLREPYEELPLPALPRELLILDGSGTEILHRYPAGSGGFGLLRDPDRAVLVRPRNGGGRVVSIDLETSESTALVDVTLGFANIIAAPNGRAVLVTWDDPVDFTSHFALVDATTGAVTSFAAPEDVRPRFAWAPDSSALLVADDQLRLLELDGTERASRPLPDGDPPFLSWAPDGSYALLRFGGQQPRLERLDPTTFESELVFADGEVALTTRASIAIAPDSARVAIAWSTDRGEPVHVSVVPANELAAVELSDYAVARFEVENDFAEFGGLSWSPDGNRLAFTAVRIALDGPPPPDSSFIGVIDLGSGTTRELHRSSQFYFATAGLPAWSADGRTLFALRFPCTNCGPGTSAIDAIDAETGALLRAFEDSSHIASVAGGNAQLINTPEGLVRTDGRALNELVIATGDGTAFATYGTALADGSLVAVAASFRRSQVFAAAPDGSRLEVLGAPDQPPVALLDANTAVVPFEGGWLREPFAGAEAQPYFAAQSASTQPADFVLSPSGALGLHLASDRLTVLDMARPAAPAVATLRGGLPGSLVPTPAWSPDERRIVFALAEAVVVLDLESDDLGDTGQRRYDIAPASVGLPPDQSSGLIKSIGWSPPGELIFATIHALWQLDLTTEAVTKIADAPRPGAFTMGTVLAYSPDGTVLVAANRFAVFAMVDGGDWRRIAGLGAAPGSGSLRWSLDGSAVAYVAESGGVAAGHHRRPGGWRRGLSAGCATQHIARPRLVARWSGGLDLHPVRSLTALLGASPPSSVRIARRARC